MNRFLRILQLSMVVSGIIAELAPAISAEFSKREKRNLAVVKTPAADKALPAEKQDIFTELEGSKPVKADPNLI